MATAMIIEPPRPDVTTVLFAWFSPAFPVGSFAYSHGLEAAVAEGWVQDEPGLARYLGDILVQGAGWTDALVFSLAYRKAKAGDASALLEVAALSAALAPSRERLTESQGQGQAFLAAVREGWPHAAMPALPERTTYPVVAGACSALVGAATDAGLQAYLTGFCTNLIAAGVRLGLCGQTGGVRILASLGPRIADVATRAVSAEEADLGGCAVRSDIASMRHETLDGRLFLS